MFLWQVRTATFSWEFLFNLVQWFDGLRPRAKFTRTGRHLAAISDGAATELISYDGAIPGIGGGIGGGLVSSLTNPHTRGEWAQPDSTEACECGGGSD